MTARETQAEQEAGQTVKDADGNRTPLTDHTKGGKK